MQMEKFTLKAQEVLQEAKAIAERRNHQQIDVEHLLLALLEQKEGIVIPIFQKLGANVDLIVSQLEGELNRIPKVTGGGAGQVYLSSRVNEIFDAAWKEAERLMDEYLSTEHLLIAIADEKRGSCLPDSPEKWRDQGCDFQSVTGDSRASSGDGSESGREVSGFKTLQQGSH